ncbi:MAG TPA: hypothetical protein VGI92_04950, partial [Gemmatimonadales bacterium]
HIKPALSLLKVSGDSQATLPHGAVPDPLVVRLVDSGGRPLPGIPITWSHDLDGRFELDTSRTDAGGYASALWVLGQSENAYHATARLNSLSASFMARAQTAGLSLGMEPPAVTFSSLGDTAAVRIRMAVAGGTTIYPAIRGMAPVVGAGYATVYNRGSSLLLQAAHQGSVSLSVPFGDLHLTYTVTVQQISVGLGIVRLDQPGGRGDTIMVGAGAPALLAAVATDARGNPIPGTQAPGPVTWSVSDSSVLTVDNTGQAIPGADGRATVNVSSGGLTAHQPSRVWTLRAAQIASSPDHTCALLTDGELACWGSRTWDFGTGINGPSIVTPELTNFGIFTSITIAYDHACGIRPDQSAWCWGANTLGQLGTGLRYDSIGVPQPVAGGFKFSSLVSGYGDTCGLTVTGKAYCWGIGNYGLLGNGTLGTMGCGPYQSCTAAPVAVNSGVSFTQLTAIGQAVCGLSSDGSAFCWGWNGEGELGSPKVGCLAYPGDSLGNHDYCSLTPVAVQGGLHFGSLGASIESTCGVALDGAAWCWGQGLGDAVPTAFDTGARFASIAAGSGNVVDICGILQDGSAYCLGTGGLVAVPGGLRFSSLSTDVSICGIATDAYVYCWPQGASPVRVAYQR